MLFIDLIFFQYSTHAKFNESEEFVPKSLFVKVTDNRECSSDIVTKENVFHIEDVDTIRKHLISSHLK